MAGAGDRVAADTDTRGLAQAQRGGLRHGFVGQRAGAADNADAARIVDVPRHDADLAFTRGNHAGAVRADQADAGFVHGFLYIQHVQRRHAFGNADDQLHARINRFQDRILGKRCGT